LLPRVASSVAVVLLAAWVASAGCSGPPGKGARLNAGEKCIDCHRPGGKAMEFPHAVAGTVYPSASAPADGGAPGVEIVLRDGRGRTLQLTSNGVGNFWSKDGLEFPVAAETRRPDGGASLASPGPTCLSGECNACHTVPPAGGARGRVAAPP